MFFLLCLILTSFLCVSGALDTFIPLSSTSYSFSRGTPSLTTVDLYIDIGCSSTRDVWDILTSVVKKYKTQVSFLFHVFPLPYHQQSFILSKAATVVDHFKGTDATFTFMDTAFELQPQIYNDATANMTYNQVVSLVGEWAVNGTGLTPKQFQDGMDKSTPLGVSIEMSTRYMWKYSTLHNVFGTPLYYLNGVFVSDGLETEEDWTAALDNLLQ